jgi:hypothetical protein
MPTDLPKNFQGAASKADDGHPWQAVGHMLRHQVVYPLAAEYTVCLGLTGVFSATLLGDSFFQPKWALGVMAAGLLFRWFTQHLKPQQANPFNMPTLTPADLAAAKEALSFLGDHQGEHTPSDYGHAKANPYL